MTSRHLVARVVLACALAGCMPMTPFSGGPMLMHREDGGAQEGESPQSSPGPGQDPQDDPEGYPISKRAVGGPTDVEVDLATSFPKPDSVFEGRLPQEYFQWKEDLYEDIGLKLGLSYQALFQKASDVAAGSPLPGSGRGLRGGRLAVARGQMGGAQPR